MHRGGAGGFRRNAFGTITTDVTPPASIYGSFQSGTVSGRVLVQMGKFNF
ncbi:MAG: hypothetical protein ACLQU1_09985 [Bryobacteraceae bacterium]